MTSAELITDLPDRLEAHSRWVASAGAEGQLLSLPDARLAGADLSGRDLTEANLGGALPDGSARRRWTAPPLTTPPSARSTPPGPRARWSPPGTIEAATGSAMVDAEALVAHLRAAGAAGLVVFSPVRPLVEEGSDSTADQDKPASAPGWFPDPHQRHEYRWWDGSWWTSHVADHGVVTNDPQ